MCLFVGKTSLRIFSKVIALSIFYVYSLFTYLDTTVIGSSGFILYFWMKTATSLLEYDLWPISFLVYY